MMSHEQSAVVRLFKSFPKRTEAQTKTVKNDLLPAAVSFLVFLGRERKRLFMRVIHVLQKSTKLWAYSAVAILAVGEWANSAVNVYAPIELQTSFIADTTNQYEATLTPSPYFAGTYTLTLKSKKSYTPPDISSPILTGTAFRECFVHGYVFGMEDERKEDLRIVNSLRNNLLSYGTCGTLTTGTTVPHDAFLDGCYAGYNIVYSTITQRNGIEPQIVPTP